jgi:hypothetical protein
VLGWIPALIFVGSDAAIVTGLLGVVTLIFGATMWLFCVP